MSLLFCQSAMTATTAAEQAIRDRIRRQGKITFAEFMQLALYHPVDGYYTDDSPFGAAGDYYTSPAVHPAFGALLAVQLFTMWQCMGEPADFTVVEMGAGSGMLADDIRAYAARLPDGFADRLRYITIDRYAPTDAPTDASESASAVATERLRATNVPLRGVLGCFISNEFVDAFPVHRFKMSGGKALEVYVALDDADEFVEALDKPSTPLLAERLDRLGFRLADGHSGEVNLHVKPWLGDVARALGKGFVITIDYGYQAAELYSRRRKFGTLQTYFRHTEGSSPYQRVGRQDITAHVDFSSLQYEGKVAGLHTIAYMTQAELLRALGMDELLRKVRTMPLSQHERNANVMALRELVKPDGLGGFKALIQEKGTGVTASASLAPPESVRWALSPPMLSSRHMPLMEGRYPHTGWEAPSLWGEWQPEVR